MTTKVLDSTPSHYMDNAREILHKSPIEDNIYTNIKYVKSAFGVAYLGILKAIDDYLVNKGINEKQLPKDVKQYIPMLKKYNSSLVKDFNALYYALHIAGYYRVLICHVNIIKDYFKLANDFIEKLSW